MNRERTKYVSGCTGPTACWAYALLATQDLEQDLKCYRDIVKDASKYYPVSMPAGCLAEFPSGELENILAGAHRLQLNVESSESAGEKGDVDKACSLLKNSSKWWSSFCNRYSEGALKTFGYAKVYGIDDNAKKFLGNNPRRAIEEGMKFVVYPVVIGREETNNPYLWGNPLSITTFGENEPNENFLGGLHLLTDGSCDLANILEYCQRNTKYVDCNNTILTRTSIEYADRHLSDIRTAASIVNSAHPELHLNNIILLMLMRTVHEMTAVNYIDIVQDFAACRAVKCTPQDGFEKVFPELDDPMTDIVWQMSSLTGADQLEQGYGPLQIILGLALLAASHKGTADYYREYLTEEELTTKEGALRAILDDKKSIYYLALIYQYIITRLKETTFKNEEVRFPSNTWPFIYDKATSREMALLEYAQALSAIPEHAPNIAKDLMIGPRNLIWGKVFWMASVFDIEPFLPGVGMASIKKDSFSYMCMEQYRNVYEMSGLPEMFDVKFLVPVDPIRLVINYFLGGTS
jgi:hypothetical protein